MLAKFKFWNSSTTYSIDDPYSNFRDFSKSENIRIRNNYFYKQYYKQYSTQKTPITIEDPKTQKKSIKWPKQHIKNPFSKLFIKINYLPKLTNRPRPIHIRRKLYCKNNRCGYWWICHWNCIWNLHGCNRVKP
jgi:hypothetical protein